MGGGGHWLVAPVVCGRGRACPRQRGPWAAIVWLHRHTAAVPPASSGVVVVRCPPRVEPVQGDCWVGMRYRAQQHRRVTLTWAWP